MKKSRGKRMKEWVWKLLSMSFESVVARKDRRNDVLVALDKCKDGRAECED